MPTSGFEFIMHSLNRQLTLSPLVHIFTSSAGSMSTRRRTGKVRTAFSKYGQKSGSNSPLHLCKCDVSTPTPGHVSYMTPASRDASSHPFHSNEHAFHAMSEPDSSNQTYGQDRFLNVGASQAESLLIFTAQPSYKIGPYFSDDALLSLDTVRIII